MTKIKGLRKKARELRNIKKHLRKGTEERKRITKELTQVKSELTDLVTPDSEKQKVIDELEREYKSRGKTHLVDFRNFTKSQLEFHLERVRNGRTTL